MIFKKMSNRWSFLLPVSFFLIFLFAAKSFDFTDDVISESQITNIETINSRTDSHLLRRSTLSVITKEVGKAVLLKSLTAIIAVIAISVLIVRCIRSLKSNSNFQTSRRLAGASCNNNENDIPYQVGRSQAQQDAAAADTKVEKCDSTGGQPQRDAAAADTKEEKCDSTGGQPLTKEEDLTLPKEEIHSSHTTSDVTGESTQTEHGANVTGHEDHSASAIRSEDKDGEEKDSKTDAEKTSLLASRELFSLKDVEKTGSATWEGENMATEKLKKLKKRHQIILGSTIALLTVTIVALAAVISIQESHMNDMKSDMEQLTTFALRRSNESEYTTIPNLKGGNVSAIAKTLRESLKDKMLAEVPLKSAMNTLHSAIETARKTTPINLSQLSTLWSENKEQLFSTNLTRMEESLQTLQSLFPDSRLQRDFDRLHSCVKGWHRDWQSRDNLNNLNNREFLNLRSDTEYIIELISSVMNEIYKL